jgi:hypothetical protein
VGDKPIEPLPTCRLCLQSAALRISHVVPKFVGRWLKRDLGGATFLSMADGRTSRQDLIKAPLLCGTCEGRLQDAERYFRENVFAPFFEDGRLEFERHPLLTRFVASLSWRVTLIAEPARPLDPGRRAAVAAACESWRNYLMDPSADDAPTPHELLFFHKLPMPPLDVAPECTAEYIWMDIHPSIVVSDVVAAVYCKLPGMLIWSPLETVDAAGWRGTRVNGSGIIRVAEQEVTADGVLELIHDSIRDFNRASAAGRPTSGCS